MRSRPFLSAGESPLAFSEILSERRWTDPLARKIEAALDDVAALEGEAAEATDPAERKRLQCEAEALRCSIDAFQNRR